MLDSWSGQEIGARYPGTTEFAVAEGRNNNPNNGDWELSLGVPNSSTTSNLKAGGGTVENFSWANGPFAFTLEYSNEDLTFTLGSETLTANDVDLSSAKSLVIRTASGASSTAKLTGLKFGTHSIAPISSSNGIVSYTAIGYANLANDWTLEGQADLIGFDSSSRPAFQFKVTDAVVPLPAAAWLMLSGLAGVGYTAYRGRKRAAA